MEKKISPRSKRKTSTRSSSASRSASKISSLFSKSWFSFSKRNKRVNVIVFEGVISGRSRANDGIHSQKYLPLISKAFRKGSCEAVVLQINSPGGSPSQSMIIADAIRYHSVKSGIPVWAFIEDVAASGGYWLASAADRIYALPGSIVGSIGVVYSGFGLVDFIQRFGIERRVHTAGRHKDILDPFQKEREFDIQHLKTQQKKLHAQFIAYVKERRADPELQKKTEDDPLFSGLFWLGEEAKTLGLVDEIGSMLRVTKEAFGEKVRLTAIHPRRFPFSGGVGRRRFAIGEAIEALERWDLESRYRI